MINMINPFSSYFLPFKTNVSFNTRMIKIIWNNLLPSPIAGSFLGTLAVNKRSSIFTVCALNAEQLPHTRTAHVYDGVRVADFLQVPKKQCYFIYSTYIESPKYCYNIIRLLEKQGGICETRKGPNRPPIPRGIYYLVYAHVSKNSCF